MKTRGWGAVALAYPAAAGVAAAIVAVEFTLLAALSATLTELGAGWWVPIIAWVYAFAVFLLGLLVVGAPVWFLAARLGRDSRREAAIAGAVLSAAAGGLIVLALGGTGAMLGPLAYGAALIPPGAAAGWTFHRVAYGETLA